MNAQELFRAGRMGEAIQRLVAEIRDNPTDAVRRTFLFELLCFNGEYERAAKHLDVLARQGNNAELGALLYKSALAAAQMREEMFDSGSYPSTPAAASNPGLLNGRPFRSFVDADARIGPRLEVFAAGRYIWIPFEHITSIEMEQPRRLRDLLWAPALVRTGPAFRGKELGEILIPVLSPGSYKHPNENVKLGRVTEWETKEGIDLPLGQKIFMADEEDIPLLEIRSVTFAETAEAQ